MTIGAGANNNEDYKIKILIGGQEDKPISCYLPEQVNMSSESSWAPFMDSLIPGGNQAINMLGKSSGYQLNSLITKISAWEGNKPLEWTFDLQFNARTDAKKEVVLPILRLLCLTLPTDLKNGFVQAPGPSMAQVLGSSNNNIAKTASKLIGMVDKAGGGAMSLVNSLFGIDAQPKDREKGEGTIKVFIGNFLELPSVVVTDVNPKFDSQFRYGAPISAECSISFQTLYPPTVDVVEKMFVGLRTNRFGLEMMDKDGSPTTLGAVSDFFGVGF